MDDCLVFIGHYWKMYKRYITLESIIFILVICFGIYCYFKYDRNRIKLKSYNIDIFDRNNDYNWNNILKEAIVYESPKQNNFGVSSPPKQKTVYKSENKCRDIFERIFRKKFVSVRPEFLKNPITKYNLELDGYCAELKLAFEYDGIQHASFSPRFHKTPQDFIYQVKKDDFKTQKCKQQGIDLIRIPHYVASEGLEDYIRKKIFEIPRLRQFYHFL